MQHIIATGHRLLFAGNQWQRDYICRVIPGIETVHLEGYNVSYASSGSMFMPALMRQVPGLLKTIKREHTWLKETIENHKVDGIISDNRYGLYHNQVPCVIMTHQLNAMSGFGTIADNTVRKLHYKQLQRFNHCWIVDVAENGGLAGKLSHPQLMPHNAEYIGLLSQAESADVTAKGHLLVLLSGPEPQRTILSQKLWAQLKGYKGQVIFTEGKATADIPKAAPSHISHYTILAKEQLHNAIQGADIVICRSGYSTVMDLVKLGRKAVFIPTPGQTEQEYLAKQLQDMGMFPYMPQNNFDLSQALQIAGEFPYKPLNIPGAFDRYKNVLDKWLQLL
jgi:UDP-N-acetylglucosamine transferase subunit ALG13